MYLTHNLPGERWGKKCTQKFGFSPSQGTGWSSSSNEVEYILFNLSPVHNCLGFLPFKHTHTEKISFSFNLLLKYLGPFYNYIKGKNISIDVACWVSN